MTLKLNCSSSGSVALSAPASTALGADVVLNLPSHGGSLDRLERAGNILQVVTASTSTEVAITALTYADSGLSASITPSSATSKILVMVDQQFNIFKAGSNTFAGIKLLRNAVTIVEPITDAAGPFNLGVSATGSSAVGFWSNFNCTFLDNPNTTSSVTYKTQARPYASGTTLKLQQAATPTNGSSRIVLMEVSA